MIRDRQGFLEFVKRNNSKSETGYIHPGSTYAVKTGNQTVRRRNTYNPTTCNPNICKTYYHHAQLRTNSRATLAIVSCLTPR